MNQRNAEGNAHGYWEIIEPRSGIAKLGHFNNGKKIGKWETYQEGKLIRTSYYSGNVHCTISYKTNPNYKDRKSVFHRMTGRTIYRESYDEYGVMTSYTSFDDKDNPVGEMMYYYDGKQFFEFLLPINVISKDIVELTHDHKERVIRVEDQRGNIRGICQYDDDDNVILYKDDQGNYFDKSMNISCFFDIKDIFESTIWSLKEDDQYLKKYFSRWQSNINQQPRGEEKQIQYNNEPI